MVVPSRASNLKKVKLGDTNIEEICKKYVNEKGD